MAERTNVPEIRFAGFTDPWEQRKLGEFSKKVTTKNADGGLSETFTNSAEQGVIGQLDYFDHDITNDANIKTYPSDLGFRVFISQFIPSGLVFRHTRLRSPRRAARSTGADNGSPSRPAACAP